MKTKLILCLVIINMLLSVLCINISNCTESISDITNSENIDQQEINSNDNNSGLDLHSEGAIVMEAKTGKVIYEKNMNERLYPASVTKILTAILTIENCDLSEKATASEYAVNSIPSGYTLAGIKPGETFTVEQLLEVMMLRSANEAATILAEHVSGSVEEFSKLMNQKAKEIGCMDSNFLNANGMHNENHYSTTYDMALIQQYCMKNKEYRRISSLTECSLPNTELYDGEPRVFKNTHGFLIKSDKNYYKYAISGKTGYTTPAKNCLVTSTNKNGFELIAVVLHADGKIDGVSARYYDTMQLLNYAYDNYRISNFLEKNSQVDSIEIKTSNGSKEKLNLLLENTIEVLCNKNENISKSNGKIELNEITLPISKGDVLGRITYNINDTEYISNLIAESDINIEDSVAQVVLEKGPKAEKDSELLVVIMLSILAGITAVVIVAFFIVMKKDANSRLTIN